jgi:Phage tail repeat like
LILAWRQIGIIPISDQWQLTNKTNASIFRITHQINNQPVDTLRAVIAQEAESVVFDRRLIGYKVGVVEGQLFVLPEGIEKRRLAVQRIDKVLSTDWTIKIEELIDLAVNLPLPISDIDGLQAALDSKLDDGEFGELGDFVAQLALKANISDVETGLNSKSNTGHGHQVFEVVGLESELSQIQADLSGKAIASDVTTALAGKSAVGHGHGISDVTGLQTALDTKAIAADVNTALGGKSAVGHQHQIADTSGLQAALDTKAITADVTTALAGKSAVGHGHGISDVTGLQTALDTKAITADVNTALGGKSAVGHQHQIADTSGLQAALDTKAIASDVTTALAGKSAVGHGHGISDVTGLQTALDSKAIASDVQTALTGKAPTVHNHAVGDVTGLQTMLDGKAFISDVGAGLAGKSNVGHGHQIADIQGLTALLQSIQPISNVIDSAAVPSNAFDGLIWNELTNTGDLLERWSYRSGQWRSLSFYRIDYFGTSTPITGTASYQLPFDDRYNYFFKDYLIHCIYSSGAVDVTTNYWRAIITTQPTGTTFANSGPIPNDNLSKRFPINQIFTPAPGERLIYNPQKFGSAPSVKLSMSVTYQLVRK